jgi:hypothetical protein
MLKNSGLASGCLGSQDFKHLEAFYELVFAVEGGG